MSKNYVDYMVEETKNILAIDSPSGYTKEVADYVMGEYKKLGYEPKLTVKWHAHLSCNFQTALPSPAKPGFQALSYLQP